MATPKQNPKADAAMSRSGPPRRRWLRWLASLVVALGVLGWFATGFYFVQPNERAVVRVFGRIVEPSGRPGMGWTWPWPIGSVELPKTTDVRRVSVGLDAETREAIAAGDIGARTESHSTDVFTGDVNIVKVGMIAQYQIVDPARYLVGAESPDQLVEATVQSVLIETLGGFTIDFALTEGIAELQNRCRDQAQKMLDAYDCGVQLVGVNLEAIEPPYAISDAFKDVTSAKKDQEKKIDEAEAYANSIIPKAGGEAAKLISKAESYKSERLNRAKGQADRFRSMLSEYRKSPDATRQRLLVSAIGELLRKVELFVVSPMGPPQRITLYDDLPRGR